MSKEAITTDKAPAAIGPYSQGVKAGDLVFVSGQIPLDPSTGELVRGDITAQTERVLQNLKAVLEKAGSSLDHVVRCTIFLKDMGDFAAVNEAYAGFFKEPYPTRATVEVARLPKDVAVEIDAIAKV